MQLLPMRECLAIHPKNKAEEIKHAVFLLPGRAQGVGYFLEEYEGLTNLKNTLFIGVTPADFAWYPLPKNPFDQAAALSGLPRARWTIEQYIAKLQERYNLAKEDIVLSGFSAGGVMAMEVAAHSSEPYGAVVIHNGAILEPKNLPECKHTQMPVLLIHNKDDDCFEWDERYVPMKNELINKNYFALSLEADRGGHFICESDIVSVGNFLAYECFGQSKIWTCPHTLKNFDKFEPCSR